MIPARELRLLQIKEFNFNNLERELREFVKNNPTKKSYICSIEKEFYPSFKTTMTKLGYETMSFDETEKEFSVKISW